MQQFVVFVDHVVNGFADIFETEQTDFGDVNKRRRIDFAPRRHLPMPRSLYPRIGFAKL